MTRVETEPKITAEDLEAKWEAVEDAIKSTAHRKVAGLSYVAIGGIVLGAGALGLAFWLGRKSAEPAKAEQLSQPGESFVGLAEPQLRQRGLAPNQRLNQFIEPLIEAGIKKAVNALTDKVTYKPSCEARL